MPSPARTSAADRSGDRPNAGDDPSPHDGARRPRRLARFAPAAGLLLFLIAVGLYYVFLLSAGRFGSWFTWSAFYDAQAEGFRAGHLYLREQASAGLKALAEPLDPANMKHWRWDYSYYAGHLYIYWGLVPAALLATGKWLLHVHHAVGDEVLVFLFVMGRALGGALLIRELARRREPAPPRWAVHLAVLMLITTNPTPFIVDRAAIYEAAIMAGSCFLTAGLYLGLRAIFAGRSRAADGWLAAASTAFGLGAGARVSLLPATALLIGFTILLRWRAAPDGAVTPAETGPRASGGRRLARTAVIGGAPAALIMAVHFLVNHLRFGSWSEFGARYQMSFRALLAGRFVAPNLYFYLFQPLTRRCAFPFLVARWDQAKSVAPRWLPFPTDYRWTEPSVGLLVAVPFTWLLVPAALRMLRAAWRRRRIGRAVDATSRSLSPSPFSPALWRRRWGPIALALWLLAAAAPVLTMFSLSMRYQGDFATPFLLAATLAGWQLLGASTSRAGRAIAAGVYLTLAIASVVVGLLLGFGGYFDHFGRHNPELWSLLHRRFDLCPAP